MQAEGVQAGELNLIFVDSQNIQQLNKTYLGKSEPTDVLAFPIDSFDVSTTDTPLLLGDVVICPEKAMENAKAQNKTLEEEIALLVLHGVLHILGYDHAEPNEKAVMKKREKQTEIKSMTMLRGLSRILKTILARQVIRLMNLTI